MWPEETAIGGICFMSGQFTINQDQNVRNKSFNSINHVELHSETLNLLYFIICNMES